MASDPDFNNFADAWLDGVATTGQGKVLQEIVENSPAAACEFALLATTQLALELCALNEAQRLDKASNLLRPSLWKKSRTLSGKPAFKWTAAAALLAFMGGAMDSSGESMALITPRAAGDIPYAIPIPGKPGFVRSPYAVEKGQVDIEGIPQGVKVKCPYTGQTFRVP